MQLSTAPLSSFGKAKRSKFGIGSALFMIVIGLAFTGASLLIFNSELRSRDWPSIDARVTHVAERLDSENGMMYTPTVQYQVEGKTYQVTSQSSSSMRETVGSAKTVRYNPADPGDGIIALSGTSYLFLLFPLIGIGLIIGAIVGFIVSTKRSTTINRLKQSGMKLQGVVTNVVSSSRQGSVILTVSAEDQTGQVQAFESDAVSGNTFSLATYKEKPIAMDVYVDPVEPKNYYVDIDDVPELTADSLKMLLRKATAGTPFGDVPTAAVQASDPTTAPAGTADTDVPTGRNYR